MTAASPDPVQAATEAASVRKVAESDRSGVIQALARAFYDDPLMSWAFPDDSRRAGRLERIFGVFGRKVSFRYDTGFTTDSLAGAALWVPPGESKIPLLRQLAMLPPMVGAMGPRDTPRVLRLLSLMDKKHPHESHFYLPIIGVSPEWQGRGIGTALLRPALERCDREGIPAYLEATSPRNRACYERNGFEVKRSCASGTALLSGPCGASPLERSD